MLLINGMPVIYIELKKSGVPQVRHIQMKNTQEDFQRLILTGANFVAMEPNETVYFAIGRTANLTRLLFTVDG